MLDGAERIFAMHGHRPAGFFQKCVEIHRTTDGAPVEPIEIFESEILSPFEQRAARVGWHATKLARRIDSPLGSD